MRWIGKWLLPLVAPFFVVQMASAQKQIEHRDQTWLGYFNQTRLTNRSGIWVDLHYRLTGDFTHERSINIARLGYIYYLSDNVRLAAGYAAARHFSHAPSTPNTTEHRPWQQIQWIEKKKHFNMMQWVRLEQRYRPRVVEGESTDSYAFNWRFRYNISLTVPLKGHTVAPKTPFLFINDELHVNAGKRIVNNYFDQNRFFVGLGYQFRSHMNAHLGYMYVFQQQPAGNQYIHINAIRLFVFHNLDFRNNEQH